MYSFILRILIRNAHCNHGSVFNVALKASKEDGGPNAAYNQIFCIRNIRVMKNGSGTELLFWGNAWSDELWTKWGLNVPTVFSKKLTNCSAPTMQLQMRHHKRAFSYDYDVIYHYNSVFKRIKKNSSRGEFSWRRRKKMKYYWSNCKGKGPPSLVSRQFLNHSSKYVNTTTYLPSYFAYQELLHYGPDHMLSLIID